MLRSFLVLCSLAASPAYSQRQTDTAHVNLYFPLVLDGGAKADQFQTTFTFVNTSSVPATVALSLYAQDGSPWKLDLGAGANSGLQLTIPSAGTRSLRSPVASPLVGGWAIANSTAPIQATATIREIVNGLTGQQFMAEPVLPTLDYVWPGDQNSLLSIANVYGSDSIAFTVTALDRDGSVAAGPLQITLGGGQETLFRVGDKFPKLSGTGGAIVVGGVNRPHDVLVATSLAGDGTGYLATQARGGYSWPISHWDRIWLVYRQVSNAAVSNGILSSVPELKILDGQVVNAYAQGGATVAITLGLSQLISDSPSELAFALAHELGHIYQQQKNGVMLFHSDVEFDADIWGTVISLLSGYDPYAAAGTLAKLSMATGEVGLASQFEDQLSADAHKSFNSRLDNIFAQLVLACSSSNATAQACAQYKAIIHPNLPPIAPMSPVQGGAGRVAVWQR